jgi:hypothetical protein
MFDNEQLCMNNKQQYSTSYLHFTHLNNLLPLMGGALYLFRVEGQAPARDATSSTISLFSDRLNSQGSHQGHSWTFCYFCRQSTISSLLSFLRRLSDVLFTVRLRNQLQAQARPPGTQGRHRTIVREQQGLAYHHSYGQNEGLNFQQCHQQRRTHSQAQAVYLWCSCSRCRPRYSRSSLDNDSAGATESAKSVSGLWHAVIDIVS